MIRYWLWLMHRPFTYTGGHREPPYWRRGAAWLARHGRPAVRVATWPLGWLVDVYIWARPLAPLYAVPEWQPPPPPLRLAPPLEALPEYER